MRLARGPVALEVSATAEEYVFHGGAGRRLDELGRVRTRALSAETILRRTGQHHFTGVTIGVFATGAGSPARVPADFHWFDYPPSKSGWGWTLALQARADYDPRRSFVPRGGAS